MWFLTYDDIFLLFYVILILFKGLICSLQCFYINYYLFQLVRNLEINISILILRNTFCSIPQDDFFFVDNQHYFFLINQTFKPFISWTNSENSTFDFKYIIPCTFYTDLSCLVSSGLFLSGDCVANDNTVKHKVMVQISKHFVIVAVSMKNKKSSLKSTTHVSTKFYNAKNNMKKNLQKQ